MRTNVPEKLISILHAIDETGSQELIRLTILKRWFQHSSRLKSFAVFIAKRAISRSGKAKGKEAELFALSKALLRTINEYEPNIDNNKAKSLLNNLCKYQNDEKRQKWSNVRIIQNKNLYLIEEGIRIYLFDSENISAGYRLAVSYCENYDAKYGNTLNSGSTYKINEIVRFMFNMEAFEEYNS